MKQYTSTWELETLFSGGSSSPDFRSYLRDLNENLARLRDAVFENRGKSCSESWVGLVNLLQEVGAQLRQASAFISCLTAQNVKDLEAQKLGAEVQSIRAEMSSIGSSIEEQMLQLSDEEWEAVLAHPSLSPVAFSLNEMRTQARRRLPASQEALASALAVDGYHAWGELYNTKIVGRMSISIEREGQVQEMSVGQVANLFASPDRALRQQAFAKFEAAWGEAGELCAAALNHLAGFRLSLYKARGWDSVLEEPLMINRMSRETLDAMWAAVEGGRARLLDYFQAKAGLLGLDGLDWFDVSAPVGETQKTYTYEEGAQFVLEQFGKFSQDMAELAAKAFRERWIEAEDRPGKRPGAFCTTFPKSKASRVFMTFSGTADNVFTLAHELGHAYHGSVLKDMPPLNQRYAMGVAETASTFAELVVADAAIRTAQSKDERLALLDNKIGQAAAMFMNIYARFLFETRFYERRKKGLVSAAELNQLMEEAQREAYADGLKSYHPHFWASKLHFYITGVPFYNFPYTFGYLLSQGIYGRALQEGPSFAHAYRGFLQDTGRMTVEELARTHLGEDLTKQDFWERAVQTSLADVEKFLDLLEER
ncbi:MAG: M3 family oligoendopeptidase [Limnochordia bacterium]|jgi:oligoendopeptidase F|nr:MAG: oligoendopeptidase [Peptococcaceae bacterium 1109]